MDPSFSSARLSLLDRGFVYAIAHVRGGQEMGRGWYDDGRKLHKKNSFTDFIDVTRYLVAQRYAAADKVFAMGGSAGGLLMGAVANLSPGDYRGMVAQVPFVDVVTTMLDDSIPLTTNEYDEWGNPDERMDYEYMLSYSPYDNVRAQGYPAMFITTGLWDSQVQYYEPAKWIAKLRALKIDQNLVAPAHRHGSRSRRQIRPFPALSRDRDGIRLPIGPGRNPAVKKTPRAGKLIAAISSSMLPAAPSLRSRRPQRWWGPRSQDLGETSLQQPVRRKPRGHRFLRAQTDRRHGEPTRSRCGCPAGPTMR